MCRSASRSCRRFDADVFDRPGDRAAEELVPRSTIRANRCRACRRSTRLSFSSNSLRLCLGVPSVPRQRRKTCVLQSSANARFGSRQAKHFRMPVLNRSEEHTSELQPLMRISYAVFCLKIKTDTKQQHFVRQTHMEHLE